MKPEPLPYAVAQAQEERAALQDRIKCQPHKRGELLRRLEMVNQVIDSHAPQRAEP